MTDTPALPPDVERLVSLLYKLHGNPGGFGTAVISRAARDAAVVIQANAANKAEVARLREIRDRFMLEAQLHAQEARTQRATVYEIYQAVTGATGEPGDWHGAQPVIDELNRLRSALAAAESAREAAVELYEAREQRRVVRADPKNDSIYMGPEDPPVPSRARMEAGSRCANALKRVLRIGKQYAAIRARAPQPAAPQPCPECGADGIVPNVNPPTGGILATHVACPECEGYGSVIVETEREVNLRPCPRGCAGKGE